jgi:hypothetical protein
MVTCLSEELTRIGLALRHLAPVEGISIEFIIKKLDSIYKQYELINSKQKITKALKEQLIILFNIIN